MIKQANNWKINKLSSTYLKIIYKNVPKINPITTQKIKNLLSNLAWNIIFD